MFNTTMLHIQAATQPYMVTDFVNMDDKNAALFVRLLPSRVIPDTDFISIPIPTTTPSLIPSNPVESKRVCDATGAVSVTNTVYGLSLERLVALQVYQFYSSGNGKIEVICMREE